MAIPTVTHLTGQKSRFSRNICLASITAGVSSAVIYDTKRQRLFITVDRRQNATHQWLLFMTASLCGYTEENMHTT